MKIIKFFFHVYLLRIKPILVRMLGVQLGKNCRVYTSIFNLDNVAPRLIHIGNGCCLAKGAVILSHDFSRFGFKHPEKKPVQIEDNVFIGKNAIILPGIRIGRNCVIGAGAVVSKNVPADTVVAGNPAAVICTMDEYVKKASHP